MFDAPQTFAHRLRELRRENGWSLRTLSGRSGVSHSMIWQLETGTATPTLAQLEALSGAFEMSMGAFMSGGELGSTIETRVEARW